jgi:hypothetical protein
VLTQQVLTDHGRRPTSRGGGRSADPQWLSGLRWCTRHGVPRRMTAARVGPGGRYLCDDSYAHGQTDHCGTLLDARSLDEPITDVVLRQGQLIEHAEAVLAPLDTEADTVRDESRRRQHERRQLPHEMETLQQHLALTRTPAQVTMSVEQIDRRRQRLQELSELNPPVTGRALTAAQVATVRTFLADLRPGWDQQPASLRHAFLRLILDRVLVNAQSDAVEATVVWRSGGEQHLWIERPSRQRGGKERWTEADHAWLRAHYTASTVQELEVQLPRRGYPAIRRQAETLGLKRPPRGRPQPKRASWSHEEHAVLQAYAAGEMSAAELCGQLPGRSWDAIASQGRLLGLRLRRQAACYRLVHDIREIIDTEDSSRRGS